MLEPLLTKRSRDYAFEGRRLACKLRYSGSDRDPKTVILAKANMLIHLNELMRANAGATKEFARVFNDTFVSRHSSILGSLGDTETATYDLVMTNPPFVTSGTSTLKEFIQQNGPLKNYYSVNGTGVEGLFVEKIVRSLKPNGRAVFIVPDGILNRGMVPDVRVRKFLRDTCQLEAVISLPENAFYTTPKKTYILALVKKPDAAVPQTDPVFSYVVTQTGETLDANRFEAGNDLPEMVRLFKYFKADKAEFSSDLLKCKLWPIDRFDPATHWSVDRWWPESERIAIGISERKNLTTVGGLISRIEQEQKEIERARLELLALRKKMPKPAATVEIDLGNPHFFELLIGERRLKRDYHRKPKGDIPVYSANPNNPFAWDTTSNIESFERYCVLWGIDGDFSFNMKAPGEKFRTTDHCGCIRIRDDNVDASYVKHCLLALRASATLDRNLRASLNNVRRLKIQFPALTTRGGAIQTRKSKVGLSEDDVPVLDLKTQQTLAESYDTFDRVKAQMSQRIALLAALEIEPLSL